MALSCDAIGSLITGIFSAFARDYDAQGCNVGYFGVQVFDDRVELYQIDQEHERIHFYGLQERGPRTVILLSVVLLGRGHLGLCMMQWDREFNPDPNALYRSIFQYEDGTYSLSPRQLYSLVNPASFFSRKLLRHG
jgi:hypothetical protein